MIDLFFNNEKKSYSQEDIDAVLGEKVKGLDGTYYIFSNDKEILPNGTIRYFGKKYYRNGKAMKKGKYLFFKPMFDNIYHSPTIGAAK